MPTYYALACTKCQHSISVTTTQAGQSLDCPACGVNTVAPRLGELKGLPVCETAESSDRKKLHHPRKGGGLFVVGLLLLLVGGGGGAALYVYASQKLFDYEEEVEVVIANANAEIDTSSTKQLLQAYDILPIEKGLGPWQEREYVGNNKQGIILTNIAYGLFAIGGLGLLMTLGGVFR